MHTAQERLNAGLRPDPHIDIRFGDGKQCDEVERGAPTMTAVTAAACAARDRTEHADCGEPEKEVDTLRDVVLFGPIVEGATRPTKAMTANQRQADISHRARRFAMSRWTIDAVYSPPTRHMARHAKRSPPGPRAIQEETANGL